MTGHQRPWRRIVYSGLNSPRRWGLLPQVLPRLGWQLSPRLLQLIAYIQYSMKVKVLVVVLLVIGTLFTWADYRAWRLEETKNLGQGNPATERLAPAKELSEVYTHRWGRFRIKYPSGWHLSLNPVYVNSNPAEIPDLILGQSVQILELGGPDLIRVTVDLEVAQENLSDMVAAVDEGVTRDRQHFTSDTANFTVLTWDTPELVIQKALSVRGDQAVSIEVTAPVEAWNTYARTLEAMYKEWIWL